MRNQSGFSLVQVLISIGILSIILAGSMTYMDSMNQQMLRTRTASSRDALVRQLTETIHNIKSYTYTLGLADPNNSTFELCLNGPAINQVTQCTALDTSNQVLTYGASFYGVGFTQPISGGPGNPAYYNADGAKCTAPNLTNCSLQVETWFQPICASGSSCSKADDLLVFFSVKSAPGAQHQVKEINNISSPVSYSSILAMSSGAGSNLPAVNAGVTGGGAQASTPQLSCAAWGGLPVCCMAVGSSAVCRSMVVNGTAFQADFVNDFKRWKKVGYATMVNEIVGPTCALKSKTGELAMTWQGDGYAPPGAPAQVGGACPDLSTPCIKTPPLTSPRLCSVDLGPFRGPTDMVGGACAGNVTGLGSSYMVREFYSCE